MKLCAIKLPERLDRGFRPEVDRRASRMAQGGLPRSGHSTPKQLLEPMRVSAADKAAPSWSGTNRSVGLTADLRQRG